MVYNAMKLFMEINPRLFDECSENYRENEATAAQTLRNRTDRWATVADWARKRSNGGVAAIPPLTDLRGQKFNPPSRAEEDPITQDSQKRLDALRLQDESGAGRDGRRTRGADGHNQVSSFSTISPLQARQALSSSLFFKALCTIVLTVISSRLSKILPLKFANASNEMARMVR